MNKYLLSFCCVCSTIILLSSCKRNVTRGTGSETTETRTVSSFSAINIDVPLNASITVQEGAQPSVQLSGYENILKQIKTTTKNNVLDISMPEDWDFYTDKDVSAIITVPSLSSLSLSGSADANLHGNIAGPKFDLDISGTGKVVIDNISVSSFNTDVSGAGSIVVNNGNVGHASYDISGTGGIEAFKLQTNETDATVSGAGDASVSVQQKLNVHISGTGNVRYKGHPTLSSDVSGVGTVTDAN